MQHAFDFLAGIDDDQRSNLALFQNRQRLRGQFARMQWCADADSSPRRPSCPAPRRLRAPAAAANRRREITPRKRPSSCTVVMPSFFDDISKITSAIGVAGATTGTSSPECIRSRTLASCLPSLPPGCSSAKSSARKPLRRLTATASASPSASMAVVEAVGARFSPQASRSTEQSSATSLACGQSRLQIAAEADQRIALALERGQQAQNLLGFAAGRERNHHVAGHQHAHVAVHRLGRMQKQRRRAGGAERGGDLLRDDAALAHAGDHHAAVPTRRSAESSRRRGRTAQPSARRGARQGLRAPQPRCGPARPGRNASVSRRWDWAWSSAFDGNKRQGAGNREQRSGLQTQLQSRATDFPRSRRRTGTSTAPAAALIPVLCSASLVQ